MNIEKEVEIIIRIEISDKEAFMLVSILTTDEGEDCTDAEMVFAGSLVGKINSLRR